MSGTEFDDILKAQEDAFKDLDEPIKQQTPPKATTPIQQATPQPQPQAQAQNQTPQKPSSSESSTLATPVASTPNKSTSSSSSSAPKQSAMSSQHLDDALRDASQKGNGKKVAEFLSLGANPMNKDDSGFTPLHWAAQMGKQDAAAVLLRHKKVDINDSDNGGWTAFHYAAYKGHKEVVMLLLLHPSLDPEIKNAQKKKAIDIADKKVSSIIKDFYKQHKDMKPFLDTAKQLWGSDSAGVMPEEVQKKEQSLINKEKELFDREKTVSLKEGQMSMAEKVLKDKERERENKLAALGEKEQNLSAVENEMKKKLENAHEDSVESSLFKVTADEITWETQIGEGGFGTVWKALWKGDYVAAKRLKVQVEDVQLIQEFQNEVNFLIKMRHPNIVMIMAASVRAPDLIIITELMKCDLFSLLNGKEKLDTKDKIIIAIDICRAMTFLHGMRPILVHRDLKSGNVLIDDSLRGKVSDFGTVIEKEKMKDKEIVGTAAYMAPERLLQERADETLDIYSFGVMMWELGTRKIAWQGLTPLELLGRVGHGEEKLPVDALKGTPNGYSQLFEKCTEKYSSKRPAFKTILATLREIYAKL